MGSPLLLSVPTFATPQPEMLASREMSLDNRYSVPSVNDVMKDNILLTIAYMRGIVKDPARVDWETVRKPFEYSFTLKTGETYAFQRDAISEFAGTITKTTDIHFAAQEGFKSDGYLFGDGVCHLASLIFWAAKDAGLNAVAPTNHDFANIPEIPREYGVAIYSMPGETATNANQNLYVKNDGSNPIVIKMIYDGHDLNVTVEKDKSNANISQVTQEVI